MWLSEPHVPEKDKNVPCCRRRNTPLSSANGPFERAPRKSCHIQELRGAPPEDILRLRSGGTDHPYFTNMWLCEPHVREKEKTVPCCRRRRLPLWAYISDLYAHRVTPVIYTSYAVGSKSRRLPGQLARFASGRVEWNSLIPEHVALRATCSGIRQKRTMLPQAKYAVIERKRSV